MSTASHNAHPLTGIRIVEVAERIAGPFATRVLAEWGADVVKVEGRDGDPARRTHPTGFATWNRSKRSVSLDLDTPDGARALGELLARADIVVHDLPAARAAAVGLVPETLTRSHPHLIVASVPPYPADHPHADREAVDSLVLAAEGFMDEQQGNRPGPVFIRLPFPSWCAAHMLMAGVLARLAQRERTAVVLPVATSLLQGALAPAALYWQRSERRPELPPGQSAPLGDPGRHTLPKLWPDAALSIFRCADGEWVQLAGAVGGWIESPPVLEALAIADRVDLSEIGVTPSNRDEFNQVFATRTAQEWVDAFRRCDVPCVLSGQLGECFTFEQTAANGYVVQVDDPDLGPLLQAGAPVQTTPPAAVRGPAPAPGSTDADAVIGEWSVREPGDAPSGGDPAALPLAGLRALDFGAAVSGPFGAQCLGDLGADVIKVEPITGDRGRSLTQFAGCHRGKRALAIDLKAPDAREILARLVSSSDIVLHNMRSRAAERLGIDGPGLRASNPSIVFSHVSAYGSRGPMADDPGYDPTAQALTGWEHANAGEGMPPVWLRNSVFDVQSGLAACVGAMLGLVQRERCGVPGEAHTSLLAAGIAGSSELAIDMRSGRPTEAETLSRDETGVSPRHRIHRLRDGWLAIAALAPEQARALDGVLGPESGRESRLVDRELEPTLTALADRGIPATTVALDQMDAFLDSDVHRRLGHSRRLATTGYGRIDVVGGFWSLGAQAPVESIPDFGEQSVEILSELDFDPDAIDELLDAGVIATRAPRPGGAPARQTTGSGHA